MKHSVIDSTVRDTKKICRRFEQRNEIPYSAADYERDVLDLLNRLFPYSVLPGIRLYNPHNEQNSDFGVELDNLLHFRMAGIDWIIEVEAKMQPVTVAKDKWLVRYDSGEKDCRRQLDAHNKALWHYLEPFQRDTNLKILSLVVTPVSDGSQSEDQRSGYKNSTEVLLPIGKLISHLINFFNLDQKPDKGRAEILRVAQSTFLETLRLCLPIPHLGHPELNSATRYVDRCRRALDASLFTDFTPTSQRWAINGTAGMGKSVLLSYAAAVLSSGYQLSYFEGEPFAATADKLLKGIDYDRDKQKGPIGIIANTRKQLDVLRYWFDWFVARLQTKDDAGKVRSRKPTYLLARDIEADSFGLTPWSAILVDEAHDLNSSCQNILSQGHHAEGFYLVVACDRHQQLRLSHSRAKMVEGVDFRNKSRRLKRIYRNPAPIYVASLALMFRWFSDDGPVCLPSDTQLQNAFGFKTHSLAGNGTNVVLQSDAHPANSWSHTVARFPNVPALYAYLIREKLNPSQVLWVRFSEEDSDFDYEQINRNFTYHNCRTREAYKIADKYIKGQDYHIVVIEGFPSFMDKYSDEEEEDRMWQFRRELYLCSSRATSFLYFVCCAPLTDEVKRINSELDQLVGATSSPHPTENGGTREWRFKVNVGKELRRNLDVFDDTTENPADNGKNEPALTQKESSGSSKQPDPEPDKNPSQRQEETQPPAPRHITLSKPLNISEIADLYGNTPDEISAGLLDLEVPHTSDDLISLKNMIQLAENLGIETRFARKEVDKISRRKKQRTLAENERTPKNEAADHSEKVVHVTPPIIVSELADKLGLRPFQLMADLIKLEVFVAPHQAIETKVAKKLARMHHYVLKLPNKKKTASFNKLEPWHCEMQKRPHTVKELSELLNVSWQQVVKSVEKSNNTMGPSTLIPIDHLEKLINQHNGEVSFYQ